MISFDRREFLGVGAASLLALTTRAHREPVRIALLAPHVDGADIPWLGAALDGARLGAEEAAHTFTLLGREVELVHAASTDAVGIVSLLPEDAIPAAPLVIDARAHTDAACGSDARFRLGTARNDAVLWHPSLFRYGAQQLNERFRRRFDRGMDEHAWAGWFAIKVVAEAALRARSNDPATIAAWLLSARARFDGHKGVPLFFDANRALVQPTFRVGPDGVEPLAPGDSCAT